MVYKVYVNTKPNNHVMIIMTMMETEILTVMTATVVHIQVVLLLDPTRYVTTNKTTTGTELRTVQIAIVTVKQVLDE